MREDAVGREKVPDEPATALSSLVEGPALVRSSFSELTLKPKLVFGLLGGGLASFSRAVDNVDREDVCFDELKMLGRPYIGFFDGEIPTRCLMGDTGSGILEGVGGGLCTTVAVDVDESVADDGAGLAFIKEASDVCLSFAVSGIGTRDNVRKTTRTMHCSLPLKVEGCDEVSRPLVSPVLVWEVALGGASHSSKPSGFLPFIETLRVTRRGPGGGMTFFPFDKLVTSFECAVYELPVVAERPRFTDTGGGAMNDEAEVDRRGRREGAAEEVEGPATWSAGSEEVVSASVCWSWLAFCYCTDLLGFCKKFKSSAHLSK